MTHRPALSLSMSRFAACCAAAGLLFVTGASAQTQLPPPAYGQADVRQDRIEELEAQLRQAEAEKEGLQRQLLEANRELTRLRGLVGELATVNQSLGTPPADGVAAPAGPAPSGLNAAQRAQTGSLGTIPAAAPAPAPDPAAVFTAAQGHLRAGRLAEAEAGYQQFVTQFPRATEAGIARFWLAYTQAARNNPRDAAANFTQYLQATPNGSRAAEAQVRLGIALLAMATDGQNDAAERQQGCGAITSMARRYPNASADLRALANREALAARC